MTRRNKGNSELVKANCLIISYFLGCWFMNLSYVYHFLNVSFLSQLGTLVSFVSHDPNVGFPYHSLIQELRDK